MPRRIDHHFGEMYREGITDVRQRFVSVEDGARIIGSLKRRKAMIEEWPDIKQLNAETKLNLKERAICRHVGRLVKEWGLRVYMVPVYESGKYVARKIKFEPEQYAELLEEEEEGQRALREGYTTADLAKRMGISAKKVTERIRVAQALGKLNPVRPLYSRDGVWYVLWPDEAQKLIQGEIEIPYRQKHDVNVEMERTFKGEPNKPRAPWLQKAVERRLVSMTREGDARAFDMLVREYETFMYEEGENHRFGMTRQDHRLAMQTALYEAVIRAKRGKMTRQYIQEDARRRMKERGREERASYMSADRFVGEGNARLVDFADRSALW